MRGADTLIPARFLNLIGHLCVLITLLWESKQSVNLCLPSQYHETYFQIYHSRLVAGLAVSVALIVVELLTFILGVTMFSPSVTLISIGAHGFGSIVLTYFVLDGWLCDWFWPIFVLCTILPSFFDTTTAVTNEHQQLTQSQKYKEGWSFYLILAGIATSLGSSIPVGYNIGVVNTPAEIIEKFCNESFISRYDLVLDNGWLNVLWSSVVSIFIVGGCTGSVLGAFLADNFGRKRVTISASLLSVVGALLFMLCRTANSVEMLILGRLLVGLSAGLTTSIVPMYLAELAPLSLTGAAGVICPMGVNVGVLVGQVMGLNFLLGGVDDWPYLLSVYALLVIVCLPLLFMLPESPKYLFVVRRDEENAIKELSRVRGVAAGELVEEVQQLREESGGSGEQWGMWRAARDPRLRLPLLLACSMQAGQQTSGINAVFYYSETIFRQSGLGAAGAQWATVGCGLVNVCTALAVLRLLPHAGRRLPLLTSTAAAAVLLAALAAAIRYMDVGPWMPYVCMTLVLFYVLVYGFGLGPIPYFIASELLEVGPRSAGMSWGSLANWSGNFLVGMTFPSLRAALGPYCFLIFSAFTAALFVFQKIYFPETQGRTPAQITELCSRGLRSQPLLKPEVGDA